MSTTTHDELQAQIAKLRKATKNLAYVESDPNDEIALDSRDLEHCHEALHDILEVALFLTQIT